MGHRITSGLTLPLAIYLLVRARRLFAKGEVGRIAAWGVLGMTLFEAAIGAGLVLFGLVANQDGPARVAVMSIHMISTFVLVGFLALLIAASRGLTRVQVRGQGAVGWALGIGFGLLAFLGISGAISALGHMLHPREDILRAAMTPGEVWLVRLQPLHPLIATSIGIYLILACGFVAQYRPAPVVAKAMRWVIALYAGQMLLGLASIFAGAPIPMQMAHLVVADLIWAALAVGAAWACAVGTPRLASPEPDSTQAVERPRASAGELLRAYVQLTKPKVISLLLSTAVAASFIAAGGWPGLKVLLAVFVGGYLAAGAANAVNMAVERDLDLRMRRTSKRPTVTHLIPASHALIFGAVTMALSFATLALITNVLAALMALAGFAFYVVVYTLVLKRRTWQNIVIGGAAGAFPPLVGYAAVTGELNFFAWTLFALIFLWTPVHFWALAIMIKDDYAKAGVPMLPVVRGEQATVVQIAMYTVATAAVSVVPLFMGSAGWVYLAPAILLNVGLAARAWALLQAPLERPKAVALYKFSMAYLALLFLVIAIDRAVLT